MVVIVYVSPRLNLGEKLFSSNFSKNTSRQKCLLNLNASLETIEPRHHNALAEPVVRAQHAVTAPSLCHVMTLGYYSPPWAPD